MDEDLDLAVRDRRRELRSGVSDLGSWVLVVTPIAVAVFALSWLVAGDWSYLFVLCMTVGAGAIAGFVWLRVSGYQSIIRRRANALDAPDGGSDRTPPYRRLSGILAAIFVAIDTVASIAQNRHEIDWSSWGQVFLFVLSVAISWSLLATLFAAIGWLAKQGASAVRRHFGHPEAPTVT